MKVVVIGGSGLIGSKVVNNLRQRGHEVVAASPASGVNTLTGEGVAEALAGAFGKNHGSPILLTLLAADGKTIHTSKQRHKPVRLIGSENRFFVPGWNKLYRMEESDTVAHGSCCGLKFYRGRSVARL